MSQIRIEFSPNLESDIDFSEFCEVLRDAAAGTGIFRLEGIRVRAIKCDHNVVADGAGRNSFADIAVRIRGGRLIDIGRSVTKALFGSMESFMEPLLNSRARVLSLEMQEIDPELSPKSNSIRRPQAQ